MRLEHQSNQILTNIYEIETLVKLNQVNNQKIIPAGLYMFAPLAKTP